MLEVRSRVASVTDYAAVQLARVLIVGDPVLTRGLLRAVLTRVGYSVAAANTGSEAVALFAHSAFSLVMVAARLPDMAGLMLARRIRGLEGVMIPRILLFGDAWDRANLTRLSHRDEFQGYLVKPISVARLVATVRELISQDPLPPPPPVEELPIFMQEPVDMTHLNDFTGGDVQLEKELATLFVVTAEQYIKQLAAALDQAETWRKAAHALKGASGNIGAKALYTLALRAEQAPPSDQVLGEITKSFEAVRAFFLGRRGAAAGAC